MHRNVLIAAVAILGVVSVPASGQFRTRYWFGMDLPGGLSDPHKAVVDVATVKPAPLVLPADDGADSDLTGPVIYKDLERIVGFSRENQASGDRAWGRITGFSGAANAMNWAATRFRDAGLKDVQVQEYDGAAPGMWQATSWEVRLLPDPRFGDQTFPLVLGSAIPTSGSQIPGGSLTAGLVDTREVGSPIPDGLDVKGKIALQSISAASAYAARTNAGTRARSLAGRGAVAIINVVDQTGNMFVRDFGGCGAPCFNVGSADGLFLQQALLHIQVAKIDAELKIQLSLDASVRTDLKGHNVIGIVPGRSDAENIVVNAHGDGWFEAAGDNGDGFATVLALARYFAKPAHMPERTLVFVISGGHHSTGLNGPQNLVRMNRALLSKTVMVVNLEHIAQLAIHVKQGTDQCCEWLADPVEQQMGFAISNQSPFLINLGRRARDRYKFNVGAIFGSNVPGDLGGYEPLGVARVQAIHSGPMYHTSGDTLDTISVPGLERAARFFAYFVTEAAKAPRSAINP